MARSYLPRYEFNLTIKKIDDKNRGKGMSHYDPYPMREDDRVEEETTEELTFKSLSAVEVLRKLIDYLDK